MDLREALRLANQWGSESGEGWREVLYHLKKYIDLLESKEKFYRKRIDDLENLNNRLYGDVAFLSHGATNALYNKTTSVQEGVPPTKGED